MKYFLSHAEYFIASRPQNKIYLSIHRYSYSRPLFQDGLGILCPVKIVLILTIIMVHISKEKKIFFRIGKESFKYKKNLLRIWIYPIVTCKFFNNEWTNHHFAILSVLAQWSHLWALWSSLMTTVEITKLKGSFRNVISEMFKKFLPEIFRSHRYNIWLC